MSPYGWEAAGGNKRAHGPAVYQGSYNISIYIYWLRRERTRDSWDYAATLKPFRAMPSPMMATAAFRFISTHGTTR